jgi:hypothetical protein
MSCVRACVCVCGLRLCRAKGVRDVGGRGEGAANTGEQMGVPPAAERRRILARTHARNQSVQTCNPLFCVQPPPSTAADSGQPDADVSSSAHSDSTGTVEHGGRARGGQRTRHSDEAQLLIRTAMRSAVVASENATLGVKRNVLCKCAAQCSARADTYARVAPCAHRLSPSAIADECTMRRVSQLGGADLSEFGSRFGRPPLSYTMQCIHDV